MKLLEVMIKLADKDKELTVEDFVQTVTDIYGKEDTEVMEKGKVKDDNL